MIGDDEIWDEFWQAGNTSGSAVRDCRHGTTFFDSSDKGCFEEGELDGLIAKAEEKPEQYIDLGGGAHFTELCGFEWCWDCQKCRAEALKYQTFIWDHRGAISRFLNERLRFEFNKTKDELSNLSIIGPNQTL